MCWGRGWTCSILFLFWSWWRGLFVCMPMLNQTLRLLTCPRPWFTVTQFSVFVTATRVKLPILGDNESVLLSTADLLNVQLLEARHFLRGENACLLRKSDRQLSIITSAPPEYPYHLSSVVLTYDEHFHTSPMRQTSSSTF